MWPPLQNWASLAVPWIGSQTKMPRFPAQVVQVLRKPARLLKPVEYRSCVSVTDWMFSSLLYCTRQDEASYKMHRAWSCCWSAPKGADTNGTISIPAIRQCKARAHLVLKNTSMVPLSNSKIWTILHDTSTDFDLRRQRSMINCSSVYPYQL